MRIQEYPDGSSYAIVDDIDNDHITFRINTYNDLWQLQQVVDAYNHQKVRPTITIPWLIDSQADRRFDSNQSSGLKLVCEFMNKMNANFKIFHPHNSEVVEAMMDDAEIIDNSYFVNEVLNSITRGNWDEGVVGSMYNLTLMSSDSGGFKPLMKLCDTIGWKGETFSAAKARSWDEVNGTKFVQQIDREDFNGKDILIIDDCSVGGGTFKGLSKLIEGRNAGKKYLAVSHMTVQNLGEDPVTNYFDKVFTTNSKFNTYGFDNKRSDGQPSTPDNLQIIKIF